MTIISGNLTAANTIQKFTTTNQSFKLATFYAYKAMNNTGINNTSGIWLGPASGVLTNFLVPGDSLNYAVPDFENASNFYMQGANGDGLVAVLYP